MQHAIYNLEKRAVCSSLRNRQPVLPLFEELAAELADCTAGWLNS